jgi:dihydropteroate synthase
MGILNRTPDSFSDGGDYFDLKDAENQIAKMIMQGADIIDIGGESTRPGASPVEPNEEIKRVVPLIKKISKNHNVPISIDTYRSKTALAAIEAGANMVNDVWGLKADPQMADVVAQFNIPVCIMHNKKSPEYKNIIDDVLNDFSKSIEFAIKKDIKDENIIIDPGIGFGKTYEHNIEILKNLEKFKKLGFPILLGISRKSMIGLTLDLPVEKRLEGTIAANAIGISKGADIIRVHDVEANKRAAIMTDKIMRDKSTQMF